MQDILKAKELLRELLASQKLAVLATQAEGQPYASLVAFAATRDLRNLVFTTSSRTRKFANLQKNPHVAMLIDSRSNSEEDFEHAIAATATGTAKVEEKDRARLQELYLLKHPGLGEFLASPHSVLVTVEVEKYILVSKFQNVVDICP
ncbi:MAG: pyridoxamine 5'-phosphate oxidase family protein [Candidatus Abyssubacteria bacterium]